VIRVLPLALLLAAAQPARPDQGAVVTLRNAQGMVVRLLPQGATVTAIEVPDRQGHLADVVLGYPSPADYRTRIRKNFFGATLGRYAGRIGGARFAIDGRPVALEANDGPNALHGGGSTGFESLDWRVARAKDDSVTFVLDNPDGYQGFPGRLHVEVTYSLSADNALRVDYVARTTRPTVLNLSNHSYFNLAGEGSGSVAPELLQLEAERYVATDAAGIPTGKLPPVAGTPLDFRCPHPIGAQIDSTAQPMAGRGYNHALVFDKPAGRLAAVARLTDPGSGRTLMIETTEPSVQIYTGGYIDGRDAGPSGHVYQPGDGVALEMQHLPDSPNRPAFPSTGLEPGQVYRQTTIWRFGVTANAPPLPKTRSSDGACQPHRSAGDEAG